MSRLDVQQSKPTSVEMDEIRVVFPKDDQNFVQHTETQSSNQMTPNTEGWLEIFEEDRVKFDLCR